MFSQEDFYRGTTLEKAVGGGRGLTLGKALSVGPARVNVNFLGNGEPQKVLNIAVP